MLDVGDLRLLVAELLDNEVLRAREAAGDRRWHLSRRPHDVARLGDYALAEMVPFESIQTRYLLTRTLCLIGS